jgi:hypothetical protein
MKDGIKDRKADVNHDGQITLGEAMAYSLIRVPKLYEAMQRRQLAELFKSEGSRSPQIAGERSSFQQPSLFDFAKNRKEIVLAR